MVKDRITLSPEEIEIGLKRASDLMKQRMRNLGELHSEFVSIFSKDSLFDFMEPSCSKSGRFYFIIFFKTDGDIPKAKDSGLQLEMENCLYDLLEKYDRGNRNEITVSFEYDSLENVQKNYEGSYFLRLR
jgi:hypothetical protein